MPCGYTICNVCNDKIVNHASSDKFKCFLCFIEHSMPTKGFIINEIISKLIKKEPKIISLRNIKSYHRIEMFYKECDIKIFLSCHDQYDIPRALPSGKTICKDCVTVIKKYASIKNKKFSEEYCIPSFIKNELVFSLINIEPTEVIRNKECENLKQNLKNIELLINSLRFNSENYELIIKEYCLMLRESIQLSKEENVLLDDVSIGSIELEGTDKINNFTDLLFNKIDSYEIESIKIYLKKEKFHNYINTILKESNTFLFEKQAYLQNFQVSQSEIENSNELCEKLKLKLEEDLKIVNIEIFNNNLIKHNSNKNYIYYEPTKYVS